MESDGRESRRATAGSSYEAKKSPVDLRFKLIETYMYVTRDDRVQQEAYLFLPFEGR